MSKSASSATRSAAARFLHRGVVAVMAFLALVSVIGCFAGEKGVGVAIADIVVALGCVATYWAYDHKKYGVAWGLWSLTSLIAIISAIVVTLATGALLRQWVAAVVILFMCVFLPAWSMRKGA